MACRLEIVESSLPALRERVTMAEIAAMTAKFPFQKQQAKETLSAARAHVASLESTAQLLRHSQQMDEAAFWGDEDKVVWMNEKGLTCNPVNW